MTITGMGAGTIAGVYDDRIAYGGGVLLASSGHMYFYLGGANSGVSCTLTFNPPLTSLSFTRITELAKDSGTAYPDWSAMVYVGATVNGSVGESAYSLLAPDVNPAKTYTFHGSGITSVTFHGNGYNFAAFGGPFIDDIVLSRTPMDMFTLSLTWNAAVGGANFQYGVINGPLASATTAKLFWASGTTTASIISGAPVIFTQNIPVGASGLSAVIPVPAANFANSPASATYVLLVLDPDNLVQESNKGNNVAALALCPVRLLQKPKFSNLGYDESGLTLSMKAAIAFFDSAVGSANIVKTSGYRSQPYQDHLYEIWSHANALRQVSGIQVVTEGPPHDDGPLQFAAIPGCPACQAEVDELNTEIRDHFPKTFPSIVVKHSLHTDGNAVDWTISGYTDAQIKTMDSNNNLNWKVPGEPWHFSLKSAPLGHGVLVAVHSPVNILVTDPKARRIGYDPVTASITNEIGASATFSGLGTTPQTIEISPEEVLFGKYIVSGIGIGTGAYTIDIQVDTDDDVVDPVLTTLATGTAQAGQPLAAISPIDAIATTMRLSYSVESGNIILNGPNWVTNAVVQWTTNLASSSWNILPGTFDPVNGLLVTNSINGTKFFRLKLP